MGRLYSGLAVLGVLIALVVGSYIYGRFDERKILTAKYDIAAQEAIDAALAKERKLNEEINDALQNKLNAEADTNKQLIADLNKLHQRESRRAGNKDKCPCHGATGADLSREDAEFLTREAARCDGIVHKHNQLVDILESIRQNQ